MVFFNKERVFSKMASYFKCSNAEGKKKERQPFLLLSANLQQTLRQLPMGA